MVFFISQAVEKQRRYETLRSTCHSIDPPTDLGSLIKTMDAQSLSPRPYLHRFIHPQPPAPVEAPNGDLIPQVIVHYYYSLSNIMYKAIKNLNNM